MMNTSLKINEYRFWNVDKLDYYIYNHSYFTDSYGIPNNRQIEETGEMGNLINVTKKITKDKLILDIGANCGLFSIPCCLKGFEVISFEPVQSNIELLRMGIEKNNCRNITLCEFALSDTNEEQEIFVPHCTDNSSFHKDVAVANLSDKNFTAEKVKCVRFDDWFEKNITKKVGIIKMDVQGFEFKVLKGMENFLTQINDVYLLIESDDKHTKMAGFEPSEIDNLIKKLGFTPSEGLRPGGDLLFYKA